MHGFPRGKTAVEENGRAPRKRTIYWPEQTEVAVASIDSVTGRPDDAVAVTFAVPDHLRAAFTFRPGQYLTMRMVRDGVEVSFASATRTVATRWEPALRHSSRSRTGCCASGWPLR